MNSRLDALQAAILAVRLRHIEEWTEERRQIAARYALLFGEKGLLDRIHIPLEMEGNRHTYHQYVARFEKRDELKAYLDTKMSSHVFITRSAFISNRASAILEEKRAIVRWRRG